MLIYTTTPQISCEANDRFTHLFYSEDELLRRMEELSQRPEHVWMGFIDPQNLQDFSFGFADACFQGVGLTGEAILVAKVRHARTRPSRK